VSVRPCPKRRESSAAPDSLRRPVGDFRLIDLFAGCGGMTRGFHDTGRFASILAVECDRFAAETYEANFDDALVVPRPIEDVSAFPEADVVIGGPPCQGFSPLNRDLVGFERRGLWRHYLRALEQSGARAFVMENVPELLRSAEYEEFKRRAERHGYTVEGRILNAADFGVPQRRRRAIVVGTLDFAFLWPEPTHGDPQDLSPGRVPWRTFRDAVHDLPLKPNGQDWHVGRNPRPTSIRRYKAVPRDGGNRFQMQRNLDRAGLGDLVPPCWRNKPTGTTDVFGRLWWDRPAFTIRTEFYKPEKGRYLHPSAHRPITLREAARCMGFDDTFAFPRDQPMTEVAKQIGNAVPPPLARVLAAALASALDALAATERVLAA
jgi:DNA (cytosine-5)-methyltransferase 1